MSNAKASVSTHSIKIKKKINDKKPIKKKQRIYRRLIAWYEMEIS